MPLLGSSPPFTASSKMRKTLGPFVKKVLRPPAGTLRGPTCSFYRVLQVRLALGLKNHRFFMVFGGGPRGPGETPKRRRRGVFAAMPPRGPQEATKRPPRGPQEPEFANGPCVFLVFGVANFWHTLQWFLHLRLQDASFLASKW